MSPRPPRAAPATRVGGPRSRASVRPAPVEGRTDGNGRSAAPSGRRAPAVRVRLARAEDARAIAALMRASVRALARHHYSPRQIAAWASLPALYHRWAMTVGGERYLVAERAGRIVGYAALLGPELTALFVRPGAARTGVGSALLARAERLAPGRSLTVKAALSGAPFYRARGFKGARRVRAPLPGGEAVEAIAMRKPGAVRPGARAARRGAGTGSAGTRRARAAAGRPR